MKRPAPDADPSLMFKWRGAAHALVDVRLLPKEQRRETRRLWTTTMPAIHDLYQRDAGPLVFCRPRNESAEPLDFQGGTDVLFGILSAGVVVGALSLYAIKATPYVSAMPGLALAPESRDAHAEALVTVFEMLADARPYGLAGLRFSLDNPLHRWKHSMFSGSQYARMARSGITFSVIDREDMTCLVAAEFAGPKDLDAPGHVPPRTRRVA